MTTLTDLLPPDGAPAEEILTAFLRYVAVLGLSLYPAQEQAMLEIATGQNVILATPTGSGKSLVATFAHFFRLARRERSIYTAPIKALANEKFFALSKDFGPDMVGLVTGDATINRDAPILCGTAEILSNMALREGQDAQVDHVILDEFHYYSDRERGVAWQIPLLELPQARFLLMSATLGDVAFFESELEKLTGVGTSTIRSSERPVPLDFVYRETTLQETMLHLLEQGKAPVYVVSFTQRAAAEEAQNLMSLDFCTKDEKKAIGEALWGMRWTSPYGKEMQRFLRHGIGLHHAGLLPKYRLLVEKLAQRGLLKIISGTDTLGVGVNIPIRTVLFTKLCKYDGEKTSLLTVRDFQQIAGRAGRKGFDVAGSVVAQAPEHVVENLRLEAKAGGDPKKLRKMVRRKPPDKGYVPWDRAVFDRLATSLPEPLISRFAVSHGMLLDVLSRPGGGKMAMARLIKRSHERLPEKRRIGRTAFALYKSLVDAQIITVYQGDDGAFRVVLADDLQLDFALHQPLSLYLLETLPLIDPESLTYAKDVLTLVESILENPTVLLLRQLDKLKLERLGELKAQGMLYEERMEELEKVENPMPNRQFLYDTFNAFAKRHPWASGLNVRPKSIARDMIEQVLSFTEYVREYGLERSEGLLLRYLSEVYKTLVQTVPSDEKSPELDEIITYLGTMVRQADSSLLDEWERMRDPAYFRALEAHDPDKLPQREEGPVDVTADQAGFLILVRNAAFAVVRALAREDLASVRELAQNPDMDDTFLQERLAELRAEHGPPRTDAEARSPKHLTVEKGELAWTFRQALVGDEGPTGWALSGKVDLEGSRVEGRAMLRVDQFGP